MKNPGLPRRQGHRRTAVTASVLLLPLAVSTLSACSDDDGATNPPPTASPAATASGARCVTDRPADDKGPDAKPRAKAAYTVDDKTVKAKSHKEFKTTKRDESALLVSGSGKLTTRDAKIIKHGGTSSLTASDGHGLNAAALARDGGTLTMSGGRMSTQDKGSIGVFAAGKDAKATLSSGGIRTHGASAHGVAAAHGGTLDLTYVEIDTAAAQAAPVAVGPGGGKVTVSGGTMTSAGCGSPGVQTEGDVSLSQTLFDLANSEAFTVEAGGSLSLKDVRASAAAGGVVLRGDGATSYRMTGGAVQASDGDIFAVQQADADIELSGGADVKTKDGKLLRVTDKGTATFRANGEKLKGSVAVTKGSSATLDLTGSTDLDGKIVGAASLTLGPRTQWSVSGDSALKGLKLADGAKVSDVIVGNGHTVTYDKASSPDLHGKKYQLEGGGTLKPA
ncbi:hypothetical protein OG785_25890 [Streptomyces sp. NBC_00006]|uniref:hypothetical protein n=1 Tax=Streptomyces sp. NBC_00006 TaxID=2975619 RepID=UPI00225248D3|nr:hypothetical protein [Streptomyces sp. NBC_00006]MCX5533971.1 hypothetical protein [Streptomyces sp. NBC_00006]